MQMYCRRRQKTMDNIRIAIYIRLSLADEDTGRRKDESNSIVNQRSLIHRFLDNHEELSLYPRTEFVDDGFTGTNTDRPAYQSMLEQLKAGKFQVVISKDFSRMNRNYIEMGELIEYTLPFLGIRYISINDGYDSKDYVGTTGGLDVVMRAIVYDAYSKDLSLKESTAKRLGQKKGRRVAGYPGYGYIRDTKNRGHDLIDPDAARIVRRIFDSAIDGKTLAQIARELNDEEIPTPSDYFRMKNPGTGKYRYTSDKHVWEVGVVRQILNRYTYTGASVGGVRKSLGPCSKETTLQKMEDWIIVPDMHEAIVSVEEWNEAQKIFNRTGSWKGESELYPLRSLVWCGNCGRHMTRYKTNNRFSCRHGANTKDSLCKKIHSPKEPELNEIVFNAIQDMLSLMDKKKTESSSARKVRGSVIRNEVLSASQRQEQIEKLKRDKLKAYDKYASDSISRDEYLRQKTDIDEKIQDLEDKISRSRNRISELEEQSLEVGSEIEALYKAYKDEKKLTYDMAHAFVDHVNIHLGGEVEIVWRFKDIFAEE